MTDYSVICYESITPSLSNQLNVDKLSSIQREFAKLISTVLTTDQCAPRKILLTTF